VEGGAARVLHQHSREVAAMTNKLAAKLAALTVAAAVVAMPMKAEARNRTGAFLGGLAAGAILGGLIAHPHYYRPYYYRPYYYAPYGPAYYYGPPAYWAPRCYWRVERVWTGYGKSYKRRVRVCY
jgi:hypothetical protein